MSHAHQGGQAPDQASDGHQAGVAAHTQTDHSEGTHKAASHPKSHMRHDEHQAGDGPQTDRPSESHSPLRLESLYESERRRPYPQSKKPGVRVRLGLLVPTHRPRQSR